MGKSISTKPGLFTAPSYNCDNAERVWSHKRTKDRLGVCFFCRKEAELRLSHVTSKTFINAGDIGGIKNGLTKFYENKRLQDGQKFYMLCGPCEELCSKYEKRLAEFHKDVYELELPHILTGYEKESYALAILGMHLRQYYAEKNFLSAERSPAWGFATKSLVEKAVMSENAESFSIAGFRIKQPKELEGKRNLMSSTPRLQDDSINYGNVVGAILIGEIFWQVSARPESLTNSLVSEISPRTVLAFLEDGKTFRVKRVPREYL